MFLVVGHIHEDIDNGVAGSRSSWVQWQQLGEDSEIHNLVADIKLKMDILHRSPRVQVSRCGLQGCRQQPSSSQTQSATHEQGGVRQRSGQSQSKRRPQLAGGGGQLCRVVPRDALQQRCLAAAAWPLIAVRGDSCQAAIGPSPQKKKKASGERPKRKQNKQVARPPGRVVHSRALVSWSGCAICGPFRPTSASGSSTWGRSSSEAAVADDAAAAALEEATATAATATHSSEAAEADRSVAMAAEAW